MLKNDTKKDLLRSATHYDLNIYILINRCK